MRYVALARAFNKRGDFTSALPHARFAADNAELLLPGRADGKAAAQYFRGVAALELGQLDEAVGSLEEAVRRWSMTAERSSDLALARFALARGLCALGDRSERPAHLVALAREVLRNEGRHAAILTWNPRKDCNPNRERDKP